MVCTGLISALVVASLEYWIPFDQTWNVWQPRARARAMAAAAAASETSSTRNRAAVTTRSRSGKDEVTQDAGLLKARQESGHEKDQEPDQETDQETAAAAGKHDEFATDLCFIGILAVVDDVTRSFISVLAARVLSEPAAVGSLWQGTPATLMPVLHPPCVEC